MWDAENRGRTERAQNAGLVTTTGFPFRKEFGDVRNHWKDLNTPAESAGVSISLRRENETHFHFVGPLSGRPAVGCSSELR